MAIPETRPTAEDIKPPVDTVAPCGLCASDVQGNDGFWTHWDKHVEWHQWLWDQLNPTP